VLLEDPWQYLPGKAVCLKGEMAITAEIVSALPCREEADRHVCVRMALVTSCCRVVDVNVYA